jgi:hypothetical protein
MSTTFCDNCKREHPGRVCDYKDGECAQTRPLRHVYRTYDNLGITVCQNCAKFKKDIENVPHHIFEHGYCAEDCAGCQAQECVPVDLSLIQPL